MRNESDAIQRIIRKGVSSAGANLRRRGSVPLIGVRRETDVTPGAVASILLVVGSGLAIRRKTATRPSQAIKIDK